MITKFETRLTGTDAMAERDGTQGGGTPEDVIRELKNGIQQVQGRSRQEVARFLETHLRNAAARAAEWAAKKDENNKKSGG